MAASLLKQLEDEIRHGLVETFCRASGAVIIDLRITTRKYSQL